MTGQWRDRCSAPAILSVHDTAPKVDGGGLQQTTGNRRVRISYPFHPLAGQSLWIRERRKGPPPTYTLEGSDGECFNVPVWMTEESTAKLRLEIGRAHV